MNRRRELENSFSQSPHPPSLVINDSRFYRTPPSKEKPPPPPIKSRKQKNTFDEYALDATEVSIFNESPPIDSYKKSLNKSPKNKSFNKSFNKSHKNKSPDEDSSSSFV